MSHFEGSAAAVLPFRSTAHGLSRLLLVAFLAAALVVACSGAVAHADQRPVVAYSFDEGSGATLGDSAGDHDGTIEGATWTSDGKYASALEFDGEDDLVSIADAAELDLTDSFTLEAWVQPTDPLGDGEAVIAKAKRENDAPSDGYMLAASWLEEAPVGLALKGGTEVSAPTGPTPLVTDPPTWTHLAVTSDGSTMRLYVDGAQVASEDAITAGTTDTPLEIGHNKFWNTWFAGKIDEVRVYDEALFEDQIEEDRDTAVGLDQLPVAAYSFDEGEGEILGDSAGDHDGTIEGATWTSEGKYGSALAFDGQDDLVRIADAPELDLTDSFTLEAWVRPHTDMNWQAVIAKTEEPQGVESGYALFAKAGPGAPRGYVVADDIGGTATPADPLPLDNWSHLSFTNDGEKLRLYIDGALKAVTNAAIAKATNANLELGHWASWLDTHLAGLIDEVRVYDEPLSENRIQTDRDTPVEPPPTTEVTTTAFDTGPASELVESVPITAEGEETTVYSLEVPSIETGETLRVTANLELTNDQAYDVTDSVRLVLGSDESDADGETVVPWSSITHTPAMRHWTFPITGAYHATDELGTQYLKVVVKAQSKEAEASDKLTVQQNFGNLAATRYTPAQGPMSQPTHELQALAGPTPTESTKVPVDSVWRRVLTRRIDNLSATDLVDLTSQVEVQNTSGTSVQVESLVKMTTAPTTTGPSATPINIDQVPVEMDSMRLVHSNHVSLSDPTRRYFNLLVRAVPVGPSPQPITVTADSGNLDVLRMEANPGEPTAPVRKGTIHARHGDGSPDVSSIPFAVAGGSEKRVVASAPFWQGVAKGDVIRGRGMVTGDLGGGEVTQVLTQLILADSPTDTTGTVVATLSGDKVPTETQVHTSLKEGTYLVSEADQDNRYLNYVVYASQSDPLGSMDVLQASVSYVQAKSTAPYNEGFEDGNDSDGLDSVFEHEFSGLLSASSAVAREGTKSLLVDLNDTTDSPEDPRPGVRRVEARLPDSEGAGARAGGDSWYGFSVYFPDEFNAPDPAPGSHYKGVLDQVRLYGHTLNQSQVASDRDGQYASAPTPVAAYDLDEGSGQVAGDSAGHHDGAIEGNTAWVLSGKYGAALSFDESADAVAIPDDPELDFSNTFTLSAWARPEELTGIVPIISKIDATANYSGYALVPAFGSPQAPTGFVGDGASLTSVSGSESLPGEVWSHLALASDGTTLSLYVNGELVNTAPAIEAASTSTQVTLGGPSLVQPQVSTWNIFTQWHVSGELGCDPALSPPISFGVRTYRAGAHTNPGESEPATPVDGEYIEARFNGGQLSEDCQDIVNPPEVHVLGQLERNRWYDFVQHTRWTPEEGGAGNSITEIWMDGNQVLGNQTTAVETPSLFWHQTPANHLTTAHPQFGIYRGPSAEDPTSQLYIDAVRSGNTYSDVSPDQ